MQPDKQGRHKNKGFIQLHRKLPHLIWIRAFESSARHLSFTAAANELGLTQAAISKQVKLLEFYLGEPLFYRKPRSLVLTKAGAAYLPKVQDSFDVLQTGIEEVFGRKGKNTLTIRVIAGYAINWLAPRLPKFYALYPDVDIRIVSSVWAENIDSEQYDFDIQYGLGNWSGCQVDRLSWDSLTPLISPDIADEFKTVEDLNKYPLINVMGYLEGWPRWLRAAGIEDMDYKQLQIDSTPLAFELARAKLGVALGRSSLCETVLKESRLVAPFELRVAVDEGFFLLSKPDKFSRQAHLFREWVLNEAENGRPKET